MVDQPASSAMPSTLLREELGAAPSQATQDLHRTLLL
jgi:hypothetical protein